jgi:hypothetical protein
MGEALYYTYAERVFGSGYGLSRISVCLLCLRRPLFPLRSIHLAGGDE